jgi:hypothetical protein
VVVSAPTGAGKTYIFELLHQSRSLQGQAVYTVPTRALANDKYAEWKDAKWNVGIATGDIAENVDAPVVVATLETQLERLVRCEGPALLVIDEYQMISDHARGANYEAAIALAPANTRLLLLSGSVANPEDVVVWMRSLNRKAEVVLTKDRPVPLEEAPMEALPQRQKQFENYWPRFAAAVMLADLAPLLRAAMGRGVVSGEHGQRSVLRVVRGSGGRSFSIVPGQPDASILLHRMQSGEPGVMMPQFGRTVAHEEGVALVRAYIESL